jgi:hypothetical protein
MIYYNDIGVIFCFKTLHFLLLTIVLEYPHFQFYIYSNSKRNPM